MPAEMKIEVTVDAATNARQRYWENPNIFAREILGFQPTDYQNEIAYSIRDNRRTSVGSCHGAGKSGVSGRYISPWFLLCRVNSIVATTAPTFRQVKSILWTEIRRACSAARVPLGGQLTTTRWDVAPKKFPKWYATGLSVRDNQPDAFQGLHSEKGWLLCVVDEAAGLSQVLYEEGVNSIITSERCRLLLIGNTTATAGEFYQSSKVNQATRRPEDYKYFKISALETPNFKQLGITREDVCGEAWREKVAHWRAKNPGLDYPHPYLVTPDWAADTIARYGADSVIADTRIWANFRDETNQRLIPQTALDTAMNQEKEASGQPSDAMDPSESGSDSTIYGRLYPTGHYRKLYTETKSNIATHISMVDELCHGSPMLPAALTIDAIGIGSGTATTLRMRPPRRGEYEVNVRAFKGSEKPTNSLYANRRTEAAFMARELMEKGLIDLDPRDTNLIQELTEWRWSLNNKEQFQLEPKDDIKERIGRSPDDSDTFFMACEGLIRGKSGVILAA